MFALYRADPKAGAGAFMFIVIGRLNIQAVQEADLRAFDGKWRLGSTEAGVRCQSYAGVSGPLPAAIKRKTGTQKYPAFNNAILWCSSLLRLTFPPTSQRRTCLIFTTPPCLLCFLFDLKFDLFHWFIHFCFVIGCSNTLIPLSKLVVIVDHLLL